MNERGKVRGDQSEILVAVGARVVLQPRVLTNDEQNYTEKYGVYLNFHHVFPSIYADMLLPIGVTKERAWAWVLEAFGDGDINRCHQKKTEIYTSTFFDADGAAARELVLHGVSHHNSAVFGGVAEGYVRRTGDVEVVPPGHKGPHPPLHAAVDLDGDPDGAGVLVLAEVRADKRRNRDVVPVEKRRPEVRVLVALVYRLDGGVIRDLLVVVGGVDVELVVVYPDPPVPVVGRDRKNVKWKNNLEGGGEDVGGGDVEGVDGGVLEDEVGFVGLENSPGDEEDEEEEDEEGAEAPAEPLDLLLLLLLVDVALLLRHVWRIPAAELAGRENEFRIGVREGGWWCVWREVIKCGCGVEMWNGVCIIIDTYL
ncbi:hypothetical protein DM860_003399 [Cuscuta australis]|uniref:Uncharacterized protein n=1 Tax=Cuscuta australis TaxID=267555 RepID=A0A328DHH4_9ASTE|nr:hypothetical protein DM860_003399 [Cuscuta australis]